MLKYLLLILIIIISFSELRSEYIIKFKNNAKRSTLDQVQNDLNLKPIFPENPKNDKLQNSNDFKNYFMVNKKNIDKIDVKLIEYAEPNYIYRIEQASILPNDPRYNEQWALDAINASTAWRKSTGKNVIIGVIDTGIDYNHTEFEGQLWINTAEDINNTGKYEPWSHNEERNGITGDIDGIDNDGNGYIDDVIGYDVVDQGTVNFGDYENFDGDPFDEQSHGTLVSGVIAAKANNETGIVGLAYDSKIMAIRAFDATGNAESDDIANAIVYAVNNGAQVLNMSFGESYQSYLIRDMIKYAHSKGVVMFSSSGNNNWFRQHYPSDQPEVICVGGINPSLTKYGFSNYGSMLDITAPAQEILTTDLNNSYDITNGTSLASPYAAAVAAMMLELNPNLKPEQIKSIMQETAIDAGERGWDDQYGSGILNASAALDVFSGGEVFISKPNNQQYINRIENSILDIFGSALSNLFENYQIRIGEGLLPDKWIIETEANSNRVLKAKLASINISVLKDTLYTISLLVNQKNNSSLESRRYIQLFSDNSLEFESTQVIPVYKKDKRSLIATARTNRKANFKINYGIKNTEDTFGSTQIQRVTNNHQILIDEPTLQGNDIFIELIAYDNSGDTVKQIIDIFYPVDNFASDGFTSKDYSVRRAYLHNQDGFFYNSEGNSLIINDITNVGFGNTVAYHFENGDFIAKDSISDSWITVGYGDSNGDGIQEYLGSGGENIILTQANTQFGNPFENELFRNGIGEVFWGAHFFDIDNDGKDDIIGQNDSSYFFYSFQNGQYNLIARVAPGTSNITRGSAIGDFDSDGNNELYFTTSKGEVYIYEYDISNRQFVLEYENLERNSDFNQYIASGDINGDGKIEIAHMTVGNQFLYGNNTSSSESVWQIRFMRSTAPNEYEYFETEIFTDVRAGFIPSLGVSYRNGITAGDVNNDGNDEFIISAFPNLYVLTYNEGFKPLWMYDRTLSNSAIVHDFDNNGKNEIGFSTFGRMRFFEYSEDYNFKAPIILDGFAADKNTIYLEWNAVDNADSYQIYSIEENDNGELFAISLEITDSTTALIENIEANTRYLLTVSTYDRETDQVTSDFSELEEIYTLNAAHANFAEMINENRNIRIDYDGILSDKPINPSDFKIIYADQEFLFSTAVKSADSTVILPFNFENDISDEYQLVVSSFRDLFGNPTNDTTFVLNFNEIEKEEELHIKSLEILSKSLIKIRFSEPITKESAENNDNYLLNPYGEIILASRDDLDTAAVLMNFSNILRNYGARGRNYTLTAQNIKSTSGKEITSGPGNSIGFVLSQENLVNAYVYPNPIKYSEDTDIYFANLTPTAKIHVLSVDGYEHIVLRDNDGNGGVEWDGRDKFGRRLEPGVYLFRATGNNSEGEEVFEQMHKFVILP